MRVRVLKFGGMGGSKKLGEVDTSSLNEERAGELRDLAGQIDFGSDPFRYSINGVADDGQAFRLENVPESLITPGSPLDRLIKLVHANPSSQRESVSTADEGDDAPFCDMCGHVTVRNGAVFKCLNCGNTM